MGHDHTHEILERLEALERSLRPRHEEQGCCEDDWDRHECDCHGSDRRRHGRGRHRCDDHHGDHDDCCNGDRFPEKRIIDIIVRRVSEQVGRLIDDQQARSRTERDGGGEKRIVDLIVRLVSEHVQEIVAAELDRRCDGAESECHGEQTVEHCCVPPSPPAQPPAEPGASEPEH